MSAGRLTEVGFEYAELCCQSHFINMEMLPYLVVMTKILQNPQMAGNTCPLSTG
jgi:hypothetical protein